MRPSGPGLSLVPVVGKTKHRRRYAFQGMVQPSAQPVQRELGVQRGSASLSKERITDHECKQEAEAECLDEAN